MNKGNITDAQYNSIKNTLKTAHEIRGTRTKTLFEWNHNRYTRNIEVSSSSTQYDEANYPLESIIEPRRPTKSGIVKAYLGIPFKTTGYIGNLYPVDEKDYYKYWKSNEVSSQYVTNGIAGIPEVIVGVNYGDAGVPTNKVLIQLEATYVNITRYRIEAKIGNSWVKIGDQNSAPVNGVGGINIHMPAGWTPGGGNWQARPNPDDQVMLQSVRLFVTALNVPNSRLMLIEMSARLIKDLSDRIEESGVTIEEELSESDQIVPLGAATSNSTSIVLNNYDRVLDGDNRESLLFGLIEKNVQVKTYFIINNIEVLMSTMHVQTWSNQNDDEVQVSLEDSSSFLKTLTVPRLYMENKRVGHIIINILNRFGFTNYNFTEAEDDLSQVIPYFWTDGEKNAWEIISDLAKSTQTAVWIDEFDEVNITGRRHIYKNKTIPDWEFSASNNGINLADIETYEETEFLRANVVKANYKKTSVSEMTNGYPKMEVVWEQNDTMVLRSSPLARELLRTDGVILTTKAEATSWPFNGLLNINGEYIRYDGKEYAYYDKATRRRTLKRINSIEEKKKLDAGSDPENAWRNEFSGKLFVKDDEVSKTGVPVGRAQFKSPILLNNSSYGLSTVRSSTGFIDIDGSTFDKVFNRGNYATNFPAPKGNFYSAANSSLRIVTDKTWTTGHQLLFRCRTPISDPVMALGTRLRMKSTTPNKFNEAGLFFKQGATATNNAGSWFVSLVPTNSVLTGFGKSRKEVNIWKRDAQGNRTLLASTNLGIFQDAWYDLDVRVITETDGILISVFVNGRLTLSYRGNRDHNRGPYCGVFAGGFTEAEYEYYYAKNESQKIISDTADTSDFYDRLKGDFSSGVIDMDFIGAPRWKMRKAKPEMFTDFGSNIHEARELDIEFEKSPVQHSKLFLSHEKVSNPEYTADAFGAKFLLVNASRENTIVAGDDRVTYGNDNPVTQKLMIYGRTINQDEAETEEQRDEYNIRVNSEVETVFDSDFIQTKNFARELVAFTRRAWGRGSQESVISVFGNPLIRIGDIVTVNYPEKGVKPTMQHIVVGVRQNMERGLSTEVTLRSIDFNR